MFKDFIPDLSTKDYNWYFSKIEKVITTLLYRK